MPCAIMFVILIPELCMIMEMRILAMSKCLYVLSVQDKLIAYRLSVLHQKS
jgi:hypothetical protein